MSSYQPTMEQIAEYHVKESDWYKERANDLTLVELRRHQELSDKVEWHLRAAAEILTHAPKAAL